MTNIFVGNLSYETSQEDLEAAFNEFGAVERVNIVRDRDTGQPRGFAFVEMTNRNEASNAIAGLNGRNMNGRDLNVNEARPREERSGGTSGRRWRRESQRWRRIQSRTQQGTALVSRPPASPSPPWFVNSQPVWDPTGCFSRLPAILPGDCSCWATITTKRRSLPSMKRKPRMRRWWRQ